MKRLTEKIVNIILNHPIKSLIASLLLLILLSFGLTKLEMDFSYRIWFSENDQNLKTFDEFEKKFGNDDEVVILVHNPAGVFNNETIRMLVNLTDDVWNTSDIIRVDSLTNYDSIRGDKDQIIIESLIDDELNSYSSDYLDSRKKIAESDTLLINSLVNKDFTVALVVAKLRPSIVSVPNYTQILKEIRHLVKKYESDGLEFYITGSPVIDQAFSEVTKQDLGKLFPILLGIIVVFLLFFFRSLLSVIFPFLIMMFSVAVTFGASGLLGIRFNALTSTIPNIMLAISVADVVHILATYYQKLKLGLDKKQALHETYTKNIYPTFLTSISTAIGFFSLSFSHIIPVSNMGVLAGFGVLIIWVLTIFLMGPLLLLLPAKKFNVVSKQAENPSALSRRFIQIISTYRRGIMGASFILSIIFLFFASQNSIISNPFQAFRENVPIKKADTFMQKHIGGSMGFDVVISAVDTDGIKDPEFLYKVSQFQDWLNKFPGVTKTTSIVDILKNMNQAFNNNNSDYYQVINNKKAISEQLFLYMMSLPAEKDLNHLVTYDHKEMRIIGRWTIQDSNKALEAAALFESKAKAFGLSAQVNGKAMLMNKMMDSLVITFLTSIFLAVFAISIIMIIALKSWKLGLISMIPNILPLISVLALLELIHQPIDVGSVMIVSICLGIVVDDSIHVLTNYNRYRKQGESIENALALVLTYSGPALIITTLILVLGFGSFVFASFIPNVNFGISVAFSLLVALILDFILLPAILLSKKKN